MAQIFHRSANTVARVTVFGSVAFIAIFFWATDRLQRSSFFSFVKVARTQPIPFSHKHHVGDDGIDCRYCHTSVESSAFAGMPSSKTCMTCHTMIWSDSPTLEPVRASYRNNAPIAWTRVNQVPGYVYFDHSIHVHRGVGCVTCHGAVDQMPLMWRAHTLYMDWCLSCHEHPERFLRPREFVFDLHWQPPDDNLEMGRKLVAQEKIQTQNIRDCYTCHR